MSESAMSSARVMGQAAMPSTAPEATRPDAPRAAALLRAVPDTAEKPQDLVSRRRAGWRQEFGIRIVVATLVLFFNEVFTLGYETSSVIRLTALIALALNSLYLVAIRTGRALRTQAYFRTLVDVALITAGLYAAGGLGAAHYI